MNQIKINTRLTSSARLRLSKKSDFSSPWLRVVSSQEIVLRKWEMNEPMPMRRSTGRRAVALVIVILIASYPIILLSQQQQIEKKPNSVEVPPISPILFNSFVHT
eukprot:scaffold37798_cov183-Skeletonema_marinoi.AAC.2